MKKLFNRRIAIATMLMLLLSMLVAIPCFAASADQAATTAIKAGDQCQVTVKALNFRSGPSTAYKILQVLRLGTEVKVEEQKGDWYKVSLATGRTAYVYGKYIKLTQPAPAQPATTIPADTKVKQESSKSVELLVSAAASLTDAMNEIGKIYQQEQNNVKVTFNFGSSGSLQQQIEQGAPADIFFSAATKQMTALQDKKLIINDSNKKLLKNKMVLVVPAGSTTIKSFDDLSKARVIALGEPDSVPAGKYGKEVLTNLKLWDQLSSKLVYAKDVRQVLAYVESGDADAGIVYQTDTVITDKVKIVAVADEKTHTPVVYPVAIIKSTKNLQAAKAFEDFLAGEKAQTVFEKYGFTVIKP